MQQKNNTNPNITQIDLTNQSVFGLKYSNTDLCLYVPPKYKMGEQTTTTFLTFVRRFDKRVGDFIGEDFDWNNVLIAGGLMSGLLENNFNEELYKDSDLDIFIYGRCRAIVQEKIIQVYEYFMKKIEW